MAQPEPTTWTIHLAAQHWRRALLAGVLIFLALAGVFLLAPPTWGAGGRLLILLLAAVLMIGSIAEFLFPVTYTLDSAGAQSRHVGSHRVLPWERVRRVYLLPDGIKLSPLTTQNWAEQYRGIYLRTPDRDGVLCQVRAWVQAAGVRPEFIEDT